MKKRILLVTTSPTEVCNIRIPPDIKLSVFDFSQHNLHKRNFLDWLENYILSKNVEILITYRCPYIIPTRIIDLLYEGVNIHPLKLPQFSGINPWEKFKASGNNSSEAVLHKLECMADTGEILMREPFSFTSFCYARRNADYAASVLLKNYLNHVANL